MKCKRAIDLIPLAAGGDLDAEDLVAVETHVSSCLPCYRELQRFRAALAPLREMRERGTLPKDLLCDVLSAVDSARERVGGEAPLVSGGFVRRAAAIAAVVILGVFAGSWFARHDAVVDPPTRIASSPFDHFSKEVKTISYPVRRDVFGGASPVLLPAVATPAMSAYPTDDYYVRIRRSQPNPAVLRSNSQADGF